MVFIKSPKLFIVIKEIIATIAIGIALSFIIIQFVQIANISGASMEPTLVEGSFKIINRMSYRFNQPSYGDIIAIEIDDKEEIYVKRIIATPGDTIHIEKGKVLLNGNSYIEGYLEESTYTENGYYREITLNDNEYFVMGDNRNFSYDSRDFGPIERGEIIGQLIFVK